MTSRITINLDPAYILLEDDLGSTIRSCTVAEVHAVLKTMGCEFFPLRDCLVKATIPFQSELDNELRAILQVDDPTSPRAA